MNRPLQLAVVSAATLGLSGCASLGSTSAAAGQPSASTSAAATSSICTTSTCLVSDAQRSLVGMVANDESVSTKAVCKESTVKRNPGNTYTVTCDVTYSDGSVWRGYANLLPSQGKVTFQPQEQLR